jgi:uncharacterized membrane protein
VSAFTSQSQSHRDRFVAIGGIGSCGIGLLALVAGLLLRHHYEPIRQACNSSVGLFSQEVSGHALAHCGLDGTLADIGTALIVCGIVILAITLLFGVALLLGVGRGADTSGEQASIVMARLIAGGRALWRRLPRISMFALAILGLVAAGYLTYQHYNAAPAVVCVGDCNRVMSSAYAELGGVPVALIGLLGYAGILASLLVPQGERARLATAGLSLIGFGFSVYLTYRELVTLHETCQWCVISAIAMTLLAVLASWRFVRYQPATLAPSVGSAVTSPASE